MEKLVTISFEDSSLADARSDNSHQVLAFRQRGSQDAGSFYLVTREPTRAVARVEVHAGSWAGNPSALRRGDLRGIVLKPRRVSAVALALGVAKTLGAVVPVSVASRMGVRLVSCDGGRTTNPATLRGEARVRSWSLQRQAEHEAWQASREADAPTERLAEVVRLLKGDRHNRATGQRLMAQWGLDPRAVLAALNGAR